MLSAAHEHSPNERQAGRDQHGNSKDRLEGLANGWVVLVGVDQAEFVAGPNEQASRETDQNETHNRNSELHLLALADTRRAPYLVCRHCHSLS